MLPVDVEPHSAIGIGFSLISDLDSKPHAIREVAPASGYYNYEYQVGPDGRWISFFRKDIDKDFLELWVSSIDGRQLWPVKQFATDSYSLWITAQEILVSKAESLVVINPFTLEEIQLSPLPERESGWFDVYHFRKKESIYTLYIDPRPEGYTYFLFDHNSKVKWKVFSWLDPKQYLDTSIWLFSNSSFGITVERSYGFDFTLNLDLEMIRGDLSYGEIMHQVKFPDVLLPLDVWRVTSNSNMAILVKKDMDIDISEPLPEYVLDIEKMILKDYCTNKLKGEWHILGVSPDGQFAELVYEESDTNKKGFGIMNLEQGIISIIEGYQFLGWGY